MRYVELDQSAEAANHNTQLLNCRINTYCIEKGCRYVQARHTLLVLASSKLIAIESHLFYPFFYIGSSGNPHELQ